MKQFIQAGDYQAAYTAVGNGKPLILLHGFFGNSSTLSQLAENLQSKFQCFSLELLGFGDSAKPKINYLIDDQVDFVKGFAEALNLNDFYLVGYSYGAWVASAYAIRYQSTLKSLGLIAPAGIRDDSFAGNYDHLKPLLWKTKLVDLTITLYKPFAYLRGDKSGYKKIAQARHALMTQPAAAAMLKSRLNPEDAVDTVEKDIYKIALKTIVIAAENDSTIPHWHSETYAGKIPHTEFQVIADADHDFVETHAKEISIFLHNFLMKSALEQTMTPHD
ncbi:alpha/beta hydrolase fold protein [[Leptolyngbya] sp. PCC 7376]|uniref:alpha/beta fold hydrolase n=1 Tax=[Leptolyngbya] sp. PCC 7376 TaxID=111781 RepID=UPI00029EEE17|nr:alpha/beta hydrolase [[Leptolyngbya] sp. PCC 7376]AFY39816.1 alpha/beta hydrolase fold protein [[Leptolyngbya] sp. PCC 7376]